MRCLDYNPGIVLLIWQLELTDWSFFTLLHMRQFLSHPMSWDAASFHWVGVRFWNIYFVTASQFAVINFPFHHFFFGHPKWCHDHWKLVNWWVDPWIFCSINNGDDPTLFVGRFLWFVKIYHGIQTTTWTFKQRKKNNTNALLSCRHGVCYLDVYVLLGKWQMNQVLWQFALLWY